MFGAKASSPVANVPAPEPEKKKDTGSGLTNLANLPPPIISKPKVTTYDNSGWEDDDWNFDDLDKPEKNEDFGDIDISSKSYKNKNLNKLSD